MKWTIAITAAWALLLGYAANQSSIEIMAWKMFGPEPYTHVTIDELKPVAEGTDFEASFRKTDGCEKMVFRVVGLWYLPTHIKTRYLPYQDADALGLEHSREPGYQTIRGTIYHSWKNPPDDIEIRTRHDCGGPILTSRTFAAFSVVERHAKNERN